MESLYLLSPQSRRTMAASSFHKFPELPSEIQLQIWESSFRSPEAIPGGLHYIGLDHDGFPVPLDKSAKDEFRRPRSGCELEQGIWTACWDSRAAAMKHQEQQDVEFSCSSFGLTTLDFTLDKREWYLLIKDRGIMNHSNRKSSSAPREIFSASH
ncbi:uncharacterized protein FFB14_07096 [Fusarium fujikuroi]|nr:uncharacterized protein FFB14_07096 [Fusarium fujikuroi]